MRVGKGKEEQIKVSFLPLTCLPWQLRREEEGGKKATDFERNRETDQDLISTSNLFTLTIEKEGGGGWYRGNWF